MDVERELKLIAGAESEIPDLRQAAAGLEVGAVESQTLTATYYDTSDLRLARAGVTLRSRSGEPGPAWTLKVPLGNAKGVLSRQEITFPGPAGKIPVDAIDAVFAYRRGSALQKVAVLRTLRAKSDILIDGVVVASLCDDRVEADRDGATVSFRELEIEVTDPTSKAAADVIKPLRSQLERKGWRSDDPTPKVVRALGEPATAPADVVVPKLGRRPLVEDAVHVAIARSVVEIVSFDPGTRLGLEPEDLHAMRVATRRLRSDLRTFRSLIDRSWAEPVRAELQWLGAEIGRVRDLDVLRERLRSRIDRVADAHSPDAAELLAMLDAQRDQARMVLLEALRSERYLALLHRLVELANGPKLVEASNPGRREASRTFPALVRKPWKRLRSAANELDGSSSDEELHEVRILAKRCRYAADAAALVCGRDARRFAAAIKGLQSVLGDHQDTVITETWLRQAASQHPPVGLLAGLLVAAEIEERSQLRATAGSIWADAQRPALRAWFD